MHETCVVKKCPKMTRRRRIAYGRRHHNGFFAATFVSKTLLVLESQSFQGFPRNGDTRKEFDPKNIMGFYR